MDALFVWTELGNIKVQLVFTRENGNHARQSQMGEPEVRITTGIFMEVRSHSEMQSRVGDSLIDVLKMNLPTD